MAGWLSSLDLPALSGLTSVETAAAILLPAAVLALVLTLGLRFLAPPRKRPMVAPGRIRRIRSSPALAARRQDIAIVTPVPAVKSEGKALSWPPRSAARSIRRGKACRWKHDSLRPGTTLRRWVCGGCGVEAFTSDGRPPKECKRALRDHQL